MTSCTYHYNGKKYSKDRLLRVLINENPKLFNVDQAENIKWLQDKLGMSNDEIIIVKGLIDNRSLGRFLKDGKILLSKFASNDAAYHEAFHKVFNTALSKSERQSFLADFKNNYKWKDKIEIYKKYYPNLTTDELIEEYLADEFANFVLNDGNIKMEHAQKSIFRKIYDFIKKLLGIKQTDIRKLYSDINSGKFKSFNYKSERSADKIDIGGIDITADTKNQIVGYITTRILKQILNNGPNNLKNFINGKLEVTVWNMFKHLSLQTGSYLGKTNPRLELAILNDIAKAVEANKTTESKLFNYFTDHVKQLGIEVGDETDITKLESLQSEMRDDDGKTGTSGEFTSNLEVDPKTNMSKQIKILLGSLFDGSQTGSIGLPKPLLWSTAFNEITQHVSGVPVEEFVSELKKLNKGYTEQIIAYLSGTKNDHIIFRNEFISTMANTINNFGIFNIGEESSYVFDANVNTRANKVKTEWQNGLLQSIKARENYQQWLDDVKTFIKNPRPTSEDIENIFGFNVNPELNLSIVYSTGNQNLYPADVFQQMALVISKTTKQPDLTKLFKEFDIEGSINKLSTMQSNHENAVDMMVYAMGKKLYGVGLNTQLTTQINRINYASSKFTPEMSLDEKLEIIRKYVPFALTEFNVTRENGKIVKVDSLFLNKILEGKKLKLSIIYNAKNENLEEEELSQIEEPDLFSLHLNSVMQGMSMTMKHSDRSTFMALSFEGESQPLANPFDNGISNKESMLNYLTNYIADQIKKEVQVSKAFLIDPQPIQYFTNTVTKPGISSIIGDKRFTNLLDGDSLNQSDLNTIRAVVDKAFNQYYSELEDWGVLKHGINKELFKDNMYGKDGLDLIVATAFASELISHSEEARFFTGDLRIYKDSVDLFKRLAAMSSTGKLLANDEVTNQMIRELTAKTEIKIVNPITKELETFSYNLAPDGYVRGVTLKENKSTKSHLSNPVEHISKLTGKAESKIFAIYEHNFEKDFNLDFSTLDQKEKTKWINKIQSYEKAYTDINENDGQSYMNLIAFRNYMIRLGQWGDGMENVFKIEMAISQLTNPEDIEHLQIELNGELINPFEINQGDKFKSRKNGLELSALHTLKSQFSGPVMSERYTKNREDFQFMFNSIFKTSYHLLLPSAIIGTNLQLMNHTMLSNGIDVIHMGSANKVGASDGNSIYKTYGGTEELAKYGIEFYDKNGYFNADVINENIENVTYLADINYLKDQVKIGNKVKDEIKGSTQSLKILLSNLVNNGKERFDGAQKFIDDYKKVIQQIVQQNKESLFNELDFNGRSFDSLTNLKESLLDSALAKSSPENLFNAIENFIDDPILETLPNKTKIENILYALISNNLISFDRPGSSYPQAAVTGYEPLGSRQQEDLGKTRAASSVQDTLKFYDPVFDKDGNLVKVNPAEIIMPLPDYWIEPILKQYNTRNIAKAIRLLNEDIANGKVNNEVTFKGLRIPNQQLSSNDVFKVKKFHLPTMQSYVIVPSEIVVKVGSD